MKKIDPQAMITAAITRIRAGGPDNVNVEAVAIEANTSTGSLYNHFLSKTGLLAAAALDTLKAMDPIKEPALWLQREPRMVEVLAEIAMSLSRKKPERIPEDIAKDLLLLLACAPGQNDQWPVVFGAWLAARVQTALATHCQDTDSR